MSRLEKLENGGISFVQCGVVIAWIIFVILGDCHEIVTIRQYQNKQHKGRRL